MPLDEMQRLLTVARESLNRSETGDGDTQLWLTLDCMLDVLGGLVARQQVTGEDQ